MVLSPGEGSGDQGDRGRREAPLELPGVVGAVVVQVEDTGRGIDPEVLDRVFDPFFTTKPLGKGTGLGLSICYGTVRDHGGTITIRSTKGSGTVFTVRLPIAPS